MTPEDLSGERGKLVQIRSRLLLLLFLAFVTVCAVIVIGLFWKLFRWSVS